jgi:hypothetical protein
MMSGLPATFWTGQKPPENSIFLGNKEMSFQG